MTVGLKVDFLWHPIGNGTFVHAFFSTICYNLENKEWGSRFPLLMNALYQGELLCEDIDEAIKELLVVQTEFESYAPDRIIWDIDDLSKQPPWGKKISHEITSLANYFVTCDGSDLFEVILKSFYESQAEKQNVTLKSL